MKNSDNITARCCKSGVQTRIASRASVVATTETRIGRSRRSARSGRVARFAE